MRKYNLSVYFRTAMNLSDATKNIINSFTAETVESIRHAKGVTAQIKARWQASGYTLEQLREAGVKSGLRVLIKKHWEDLHSEESIL